MTKKYAWEGKGLDEAAAKELYLWIKSDGTLYDRQYVPIQKNLVAKKARGIYDRALAAKLFGYLAESGAKRYNKEVGYGVERIPSYFPKAVRDAVAEELRDNFEIEYDLGNYDAYISKKYRPKTAGRVVRKRPVRKSAPGAGLSGMRR